MKSLLTPRKALALLAIGLGTRAFALSLGPVQGAATVGQPLSLSVPLRLDSPGDEPRCVRAEVAYGDAKLAADQLRVQLDAGAGTEARVRLSSPRVLDEAFVTVLVRAGCEQEVTRRFVMLAEPPREPGMTSAAAPLAPPAPLLKKQRATRVAATPARPAAPPAPPRLRLEGMVIPVRTTGLLRASTEMHSTPAADATQRAAAALLWQALNAQPQDVLRSGERLRALENDLASLRELSLKHRHELARLREQPAAASAPLSVPWPWALGFAAAVALAFGLLKRRGPAGAEHLRGWDRPTIAPETDLDHLDSQLAPASLPALRPSAPAPVAAAESVPDVFASLPPVALHAQASPQPLRELEPIEFDFAPAAPVQTAPAANRPVRAQGDTQRVAALSAVLQEVEFLVSIGYAGQAIDVLRTHLEDTREPCALAVLELLHLCREAGDAQGVAATQEQFRRLFGEEPPPAGANSGLEACEPALARIMAAWPDAEVLDIIDQLLFGPPAALGGFPGLHAWRDLLWLHGLAQDTLHGADSAREQVAPSVEGTEEMTLERLSQIGVDGSPQRFAMDLSLAEVPSERHRVLDLQAVPRLPPMPDLKLVPAEPQAPPTHYEDFFEAAVAAEGRHLHLHT